MPVKEEPGAAESERSPGERFGEILREWRIAVSRFMDEAEAFTREQPAAGIASSFLLGYFLGRLFRRR